MRFLKICQAENQKKSALKSIFVLYRKMTEECLQIFFSDFGKYKDCESQVKMCRYFIKEFERAGQDSEKEQRNRILLYRKLGIIVALATAVIFL